MLCPRFYADEGRPGLPPGRYFRLPLIGRTRRSIDLETTKRLHVELTNQPAFGLWGSPLAVASTLRKSHRVATLVGALGPHCGVYED